MWFKTINSKVARITEDDVAPFCGKTPRRGGIHDPSLRHAVNNSELTSQCGHHPHDSGRTGFNIQHKYEAMCVSPGAARPLLAYRHYVSLSWVANSLCYQQAASATNRLRGVSRGRQHWSVSLLRKRRVLRQCLTEDVCLGSR
jgi:hypothetical protein